MKNPFIELCGCMCLTLLAPQPAAAKTAGEVPPADTLRTVFFTDIHVTPGNAQDSLFRIAVAEANASDADLVIFGGDLTNMGSDRELAHVHGLMSQLRKPVHGAGQPR
ncbi:MAG: metallophosphoesterase family protein [Alistipes finegoldii]